MTQHLYQAIGEYGLLIVFVNVLIDQIGLPVPALPTLVIAGALAADGRLPVATTFSLAVLACLLADCAWYLVGQIYGLRVLRLLCRISLEPDSCVGRTQSRFERWGLGSLMIAKFIPGLAVIAPPLAGALRIGWVRFAALSAIGAALWVGVGLAAGMLFKSRVAVLLLHIGDIGGIAAAVVAVALAGYLAFKWWERRRFYESLRMARIEVEDLYDLIKAGSEPVIVDVRTTTARELDPHWIPGALHVPLQNIAERVKDLPRDRDIILYCACPSEASAARVARVLMSHGFKKVRPLRGGLDAWAAAGYALVGVDGPRNGTGEASN